MGKPKQLIWYNNRSYQNGDIYMITYTTKEDEGVTMAVFTSNDMNFEVPLTDIEEDDIQAHLQAQVDFALQQIEIMNAAE